MGVKIREKLILCNALAKNQQQYEMATCWLDDHGGRANIAKFERRKYLQIISLTLQSVQEVWQQMLLLLDMMAKPLS